ncbi:hypothetical protein [Haloarcula sediminis]|uniref:hypothetical protein n=1 Tax=Haloarcula sediminis TaxID=3111777 RepID=UPI002D7812A1|nr:hypothetical protein [Haloarcula sp. CK38]
MAFEFEDSDGNRDIVVRNVGTNEGDFSVDIDLGNLGTELAAGEVTVRADQGAGFVEAEATTTFEVDTDSPTVEVTGPSSAEQTAAPTITGTVSDQTIDSDIGSVSVAIRNSDDKYYDGSSWSPDRQWLTADVSDDGTWSYDTSSLDIPDDAYTVYVKATDGVGNTHSYFDGPGSSSLQVSYTLDTETPSVSNPGAAAVGDGDKTVQPGDSVRVTADVSDSPAGVDTVTADASDLGGPTSLELTEESDGTYAGSFTISDPEVGDGPVTLPVTATDTHGQTSDPVDTPALTLETTIASVEQLTLHQNVVGTVADQNSSIRVTASGVRDEQGNLVAGGSAKSETATLVVGSTQYEVTVTDGAVDARIDPTQIPDGTDTGTVTVELAEADDSSATDSVRLMHEVRDLDSGYQIVGTPMDAETVVTQYTDSELTYEPTNSSWIGADMNQAGSTYYVSGINDSARIGYVFSDDAESHTRQLHEGYNLVTPTIDLNDGSSITFSSELGSISLVSMDQLYRPESGQGTTAPENLTFATLSSDDDISSYQGYYVYVEAGEKWGVITDESYAPAEGSHTPA